MFFAIETHSEHRHTCTRREKAEGKKKRREGCISAAPRASFHFFIPGSRSRTARLHLIISHVFLQVTLSGRNHKHMASLVKFVLQSFIRNKEAMNVIKFMFQITQHKNFREIGYLLRQSCISENIFLKNLNRTPLSTFELKRQREKTLSANKVPLGFNNNLIFCRGPTTGAPGLHNQTISF